MIKCHVLILFYCTNQTYLIREVCRNLSDAGISTDALDTRIWNYIAASGNRLPIWTRLLRPFLRVPKLRGMLMLMFTNRLIKSLLPAYEMVDIHFYGNSYDSLFPYIKSKGKKLKIPIWGSDFYRVSIRRREEQRAGYEKADIIQVATAQIKKDFLGYYGAYEEKIRIAHFGLTQLEELYRMQEMPGLLEKSFLGINSSDKIVVTCGYNASPAQQHERMIEAISKLPGELKKKIALLFPMTYGGNEEYIKRMADRVAGVGVPWQIIDKNLSQQEVLTLRILSDIVLNIQESDAFSASLQEHVMAGGVLIAGDWLPYSILEVNDIKYIKTSLDDLGEKIEDCIRRFGEYRKQCSGNREKMYRLSSWKYAIKDWMPMYRN